jgi:Protein of unknown function (DUF4232)
MLRRWRISLSFVAAGSVLALALGLLVAPASGRDPSSPPCATSNLRLDFVDASAATSHRLWDLSLRNVGSTTCHLKGFPGVGLLDSGARLINDSVFRETAFKPQNVTLKPWQPAYFSFIYAVSGPCRPHFFYAYGIQVFPPNNTQRLVYYAGKFDVCAPPLSHPGVYPVRAKLAPL